MKLVPAVLLIPIAVAGLAVWPAGARSAAPPFERFADSLMAAELGKHHIPGAVLAVVRDGRLAFARGYGYADLERRTQVDADRTIFRVASISKVFTATAAMQLVEQGRLELHADVNAYLRPFKMSSAYGRPVTLFDLLTHTAGFDESNIARKAWRPSDVEPLGDYLARRMPSRIRPPGRLIVYSNHGMALAGHLIEIASGMPFERYMRERIFAPLGMTHSSFALVPDSVALLATGYQGDPPLPQRRDYTRTIPASMLSASGTDVARFMIAHLEGGAVPGVRLLSDSSLAAMHRRQFTHHPLLTGVGLGFWERLHHGQRALWHDGDASGFASLLYMIPERRTGYFMAFNSRAGNRARREIVEALLARDFPPARPIARPDVNAEGAKEAPRLAGTYVHARYGHRSMERIAALARQTRLVANEDGSLIFLRGRYLAIGPGLFQSQDGEARLAYRRDRAGGVTHLFESGSFPDVYERVPWHGTVNAQLAWLLFCALGFAWQVFVALYRVVARRPPGARGVAERWIPRALTIVAATNLAFLAGFALAVAGAFGSLEYGVPGALIALLTLPLVTAALTIAAGMGFGKAWRGTAGALSRARLLVALLAAVAFIPWLAYWNLLGYRF